MVTNYYKPTLQTVRGGKGNCLSACIATLFPIHIDDVIFFEDDYEWVAPLSVWCGEQLGKFVIPVNLSDDLYPLLCGSMIITTLDSSKTHTERHAVIVQDGYIVFDPMCGEVYRKLPDDCNPVFLLFGDIHNAEVI